MLFIIFFISLLLHINNNNNNRQIANSHIFVSVAIESSGTWNNQAVELLQELGRGMTAVTEDTREATYLFQRMSMALQRGNAVSFHSTFSLSPPSKRRCGLTCLVFNILPLGI